MKDELENVPGVVRVSASGYKPTSIEAISSEFQWEGKTHDAFLYYNPVSIDYIETYNLKLVQGRSFRKEYASDASGAFIINQECARQMGFDDAVGKQMEFQAKKGEIIGVIADYHFQTLKTSVNPLVLYLNEEYLNEIHIKVDNVSNFSEFIAGVRAIWEKTNPLQVFSYSLIEDEFAKKYKGEYILANALSGLSLIALAIACLGIVGLILHKLEFRKREIAIRKVNGASDFSIFILFSKEYTLLLTAAIVLSYPIVTRLMQPWLSSFEQYLPMGPFQFFYSALFVFAVSQLTLYATLRKRIRINPSVVLAAP